MKNIIPKVPERKFDRSVWVVCYHRDLCREDTGYRSAHDWSARFDIGDFEAAYLQFLEYVSQDLVIGTGGDLARLKQDSIEAVLDEEFKHDDYTYECCFVADLQSESVLKRYSEIYIREEPLGEPLGMSFEEFLSQPATTERIRETFPRLRNRVFPVGAITVPWQVAKHVLEHNDDERMVVTCREAGVCYKRLSRDADMAMEFDNSEKYPAFQLHWTGEKSEDENSNQENK